MLKLTQRAGTLRATAAALLVGLVVATLAGCGGSSIDPKKAAEAQAAIEGTLGQGTADTSGDPQTEPGVDDGSGTPTDTGGTPTDTGGTPTDTGGGGGTGGGGTGGGGGGGAPPAAAPQVSCSGFKNGQGITDDYVSIGNASDISGPVPGLFTQTQQAIRAYVAYFNSSGATLCGRKLKLDLYDSRTDNGADQQAYIKGCSADFAMVGSMSAFDAGGAKAAQDCGIPDIRAIATTPERGACKTCYAAQPAGPLEFQNAVPDFLKRHSSGSKAAMFYINIGASAVNGESQVKHGTNRGLKYVVNSGIDVAEFNYGPYVQQLKSKGAETVQFIASPAQFARLALAMESAGYKPKVYLIDPSAYDPDYPKQAGSAAKGTVVFLNFTPFEEAGKNAEIKLYLNWLHQVSPGAEPGFFGLFAWSSARLFMQEATKLGGDLNRKTLLSSMAKVDNWTAYGMHAPQHVGAKRISDCWRFIQWTGSAWIPIDGTKYQCRGVDR